MSLAVLTVREQFASEACVSYALPVDWLFIRVLLCSVFVCLQFPQCVLRLNYASPTLLLLCTPDHLRRSEKEGFFVSW